MQQRHSINRGGERNWENAHKAKNIRGIRTPVFGVEFDKRKFCGQEIIDQAADLKMSGGYTRKRNVLCEKCFTQKSNSGACNCTE